MTTNIKAIRSAFLLPCRGATSGAVRVEVLADYKGRTKIRAINETTVGHRGRVLKPGETATVAAWSVVNVMPSTLAAQRRRRPNGTHPRQEPDRFFLVLLETVDGNIVHPIKAKGPGTAVNKAEKLTGVIRTIRWEEISRENYEIARQRLAQSRAA